MRKCVLFNVSSVPHSGIPIKVEDQETAPLADEVSLDDTADWTREGSREVGNDESESRGWSSEASAGTGRSTSMDEVSEEEEDQGLVGIGALIRKSLAKKRTRWDPDRLNFLLQVLEAYIQSIQVFQRVCREISAELDARERALLERENKLREGEQQARARQNLSTWQARLSEQEAQLLAHRSEFEDSAIQRIQDCLRRVADWERQSSSAIRSLASSL